MYKKSFFNINKKPSAKKVIFRKIIIKKLFGGKDYYLDFMQYWFNKCQEYIF
jgi:hypothetical protein